MAKQKTPKYPKEVFVQWSVEGDERCLLASETEEGVVEIHEQKRVAVYTFARMVTVENNTTIREE